MGDCQLSLAGGGAGHHRFSQELSICQARRLAHYGWDVTMNYFTPQDDWASQELWRDDGTV